MRATAIAQPNIALIKYWGKRDSDRNLPAVGSLSVTLGSIGTRTTVEFDAALDSDRVHINEQEVESVDRRIEKCLDRFREKAAIAHKAVVTTANDFPTGAGLASSASGFAALVVAVGAVAVVVHAGDVMVDLGGEVDELGLEAQRHALEGLAQKAYLPLERIARIAGEEG